MSEQGDGEGIPPIERRPLTIPKPPDINRRLQERLSGLKAAQQTHDQRNAELKTRFGVSSSDTVQEQLQQLSDPMTDAKSDVPLTQEVQELINALNPGIPEIFRDQAARAAEFVALLDQGRGLDDPEIRRFVHELSSSAYISFVSLASKLTRVDPEKALPQWLQPTFLQAHGFMSQHDFDQAEALEIKDAFQKFQEQKQFDFYDTPNGRYYKVSSPQNGVPSPRWYKGYVEGASLVELAKSNAFSGLFNTLEQGNFLPSIIKLTPDLDSLVCYFDKDIQEAEGIEGVFHNFGVDFRGPGQDVWEPTIKGGEVVVGDNSKYSNDQALGVIGERYKLESYNPRDFLHSYLSLCLRGGKAPDNPYKTSFVYVSDPNDETVGKEDEFRQKAEEVVQYPVVIGNRRELSLVA